MVETPCRTEQLGHAHVLATEDAILYVHVRNIKILFLFEGLEFLGQLGPWNNQVEVASLEEQ